MDMQNYRKLLGIMLVIIALCFFSSRGWAAGTARNFTVDFSNAAFSSVSGNALRMQSSGVSVNIITTDPITGQTSASTYTYDVIWEFNYDNNTLGIVSATRTTGGGTTTTGGSTVTDVEGNVYNTVTIGAQTWMKENLKVTKYRDGTAIPTTTSSIYNETSPKYQWAYDGAESNVSTYGRLYTWYAATDSRGVCPTGWHLPTDAEWTTLTTYLGGESVAGGKMKETGTTHWSSPNTGADNSSGFTALPGGYRDYFGGTFYYLGYGGYWWSATEASSSNAWYRYLLYSSGGAGRGYSYEYYGFSVRCVGD
jgi:uncharacterized protein (TIGR02145 family)